MSTIIYVVLVFACVILCNQFDRLRHGDSQVPKGFKAEVYKFGETVFTLYAGYFMLLILTGQT